VSTAYIGLGSNLDQPVEQLRRAMLALAELAESAPQCSSLYRTAPIGVVSDQPDFINACCRIDTKLSPEVLLMRLLEIEAQHGRRRTQIQGSARTLDLDLLLYDQLTQDSATLVLPHPRLHERAFVLYPLMEIAPDLLIPGRGPVVELARRCADQRIERLDADVVGAGEPKGEE
jgi:2-amino-4-hydroxy-6-hydroxymethyldihydropteridine diphosphokinase